jgi:hypothetical protein
LLTCGVKMFLKDPDEMEEVIGSVLEEGAE